MKNIALVIIDPQDSFCKVVEPSQQQILHSGELCVNGAWEDMDRVAQLINRLGRKIDSIKVTLDSHQVLHIAHPTWYRNVNDGTMPNPFTIMREENGNIIGSVFDPANGQFHDVGQFRTFTPGVFARTVDYLRTLKAKNRYPHCIWPLHCLIGTPGHNVVPQLLPALFDWSQQNGSTIDFVTKGSNPFSEHFGAVQAEVPDPNDPDTQLNIPFINTLMEADEIVFAGEAGSHCLANTVVDIANNSPAADDAFVKKCVLLTDGTSPVPGFEQYQTDFIKSMTARGMRLTTTKDYLA